MRRLLSNEALGVKMYFEAAASQAKFATCLRAKCGTVIVSANQIIGRGYNSPPLDNEKNRTCDQEYISSRKPKYDKTCCIHAEWRALLDAYKKHSDLVKGSTLYFMRVDGKGNFTDAGEPYCTVCSRLAMESGIENFALWNNDGVDWYDTVEYDQKSYAYHLA